MEIQRISAYEIGGEASTTSLPFSTYSKFKYGHKPSAMKIARAMYEALINEYSVDWFAAERENVVITTSPYWYAQPAAHALATHVLTELNAALMLAMSYPLRYVRIHRSSAPTCDFGNLTLEERKKNMAANKLSADAAIFKDRTIFVFEDARITGSHEQKIVDYMEEIGAAKVVFVYGVLVPHGATDPHIEHRMNHDTISDLDSLHDIMRHYDRYVLNSRVCRFILERGDTEEFDAFLARISNSTLTDIFRYGMNDGYGLSEKYRAGMLKIHAEIVRRGDYLIHESEDAVEPEMLVSNVTV